MSELKLTAQDLAKEQRAISISEFFLKNKHLLGFDNPRKALVTTIKESVDNSLDACEQIGVLPEIEVKVTPLTENRFKVFVEDNGPGIVEEQIPRIFAKLLYGSKFDKLRSTRGQQGIGISASVLYAQLTTGKPTKITSKTNPKSKAHYFELHIDTKNNEPEILKQDLIDWPDKKTGTRIELELEAEYHKGQRSIDEYLKHTAIVNPHLYLIYRDPEKKTVHFPRVTNQMPKQAKTIKPHPYGIELGILIRMLKDSKYKKLKSFLTNEFSRVSSKVADEILKKANLEPNALSSRIARQEADNLLKAMRETKIMAPPTDCVVPIGESLVLKGLKKEVEAEFYEAITRPPSVYRGYPFIIEAGIAYGGNLAADEPMRIMRFANRVPLQYQPGACATTKAIVNTNWRQYGLSQSSKSLPVGPVIVLIHVASVWVPFTSESKEAIAHYPEIIKEMKLALQECGRRLGKYVKKRKMADVESKRKSYIEKYIPHIGIGLKEILNLKEEDEKKVVKVLKEDLEKTRPNINLKMGKEVKDE